MCLWYQYAAPLHHSSGTLTEDDKLVSLGFSDQLPSAQGLLQGQTQYTVNQVVPAIQFCPSSGLH